MKHGLPRKRQPQWPRRIGLLMLAFFLALRVVAPVQAAPDSIALKSDLPAFVLASICVGNGIVDETDGPDTSVPPCPQCLIGGCLSIDAPNAESTTEALFIGRLVEWSSQFSEHVDKRAFDHTRLGRAPPYFS